MTVHVVLNTRTASDSQREVQAWADAHPGVTVISTRSPGEAREAVRDVLHEGTDRLIAAGGDGTLSLLAGEVLNQIRGTERPEAPEHADAPGVGDGGAPIIGLCSLGTGNDYARSLGLPSSTNEALDLAVHADPTDVDVLRATGEESGVESRWVINAAAGGFSGEVDEAISREQKDRWGALAFILGAADIAPNIPRYETQIRYQTPDGDEKRWSGETVNVICANGQTIGGGRSVAPTARLDDGTFDLVVVRHGDLPDLARTAARLLAGSWEEDDQVHILRARSADIRSDPGLKFNVDGDLWTERPIRVETVPEALRVAASPDAPALRE